MPSRCRYEAGVFLAIATMASTQQILPTSATAQFPACAVSCAALVQAQQLCSSNYPAGTSQLTYENCFCQYPSIAALYSTPDSICAGECTAEPDRTELQTWFLTFCNEVKEGIDPNAISTTQPTATASIAVVTITSTSTSAPAPTITGTGSNQDAAPARQQSWIDSHWRWVLMLGVLVVALGLLAWLAVWLKRRHRRKLDERRAAVSGFPSSSEKRREGVRSATPELWGPHQHMAATKGWQYPTEPAGVIPEDRRKSQRNERKRSKRDRPRSSRGPEMIETASRPSNSRHGSSRSKGKGKEGVESSELRSESSRRHGSRSRSHRRRERDRDKTQDSDVEKGLRGLSRSPEK